MKPEEAQDLVDPHGHVKINSLDVTKLFYKVGAEGKTLGVVLALRCCPSVAVGGSPGVARVAPFGNKYKVRPQPCPLPPHGERLCADSEGL